MGGTKEGSGGSGCGNERQCGGGGWVLGGKTGGGGSCPALPSFFPSWLVLLLFLPLSPLASARPLPRPRPTKVRYTRRPKEKIPSLHYLGSSRRKKENGEEESGRAGGLPWAQSKPREPTTQQQKQASKQATTTTDKKRKNNTQEEDLRRNLALLFWLFGFVSVCPRLYPTCAAAAHACMCSRSATIRSRICEATIVRSIDRFRPNATKVGGS